MSNVPSIWQCLPNLQLLLFMHKLIVVGHMDQKNRIYFSENFKLMAKSPKRKLWFCPIFSV